MHLKSGAFSLDMRLDANVLKMKDSQYLIYVANTKLRSN